MKHLITIISTALMIATLCLPQQVKAQSPEKLSYQAVVRDANDKLLINQVVGMQISILQGAADGSAVYTETNTPTTNAFGLVSIEIGTGIGNDNFSEIDWTIGTYYIKTEIDPLGGSNYTITSVSQLLSVPYAMHAKTAASITGRIPEIDPVFDESVASNITTSDITNWNNKITTEVDGSVSNELQVISISNDTIFLSDGGFVKLPEDISFSGSFNDLTDVPADLDTDGTDDFDGVFTSLSGIPSGLSDGDDNTQLDEAAVDAFVANNGYLTAEIDGSTSNEIQDLQLVGHNLTITKNGTATTIDLSPYMDNTDTQLDEAAVDAFVENNGYLTSFTEVDGDVTNEIELPAQSGNSGKMLTTNGTSPSWTDVSFNDLTDVPANLDTDDTDDFDGTYSSLTGAPTNVSTFSNDAGYLTSEVDGSTTNEIELPAQSDNSGKMLTTDGTSPSWADVSFNDLTDVPANLDTDDTDDFDGAYSSLSGAPTNVSTFTNDAGYLTSEVDGSTTNEIELPAQSDNSGKMLTTDGTSPSWADVSFNDLTDVPANLDTDDTDDFDGAYSRLSGAPTNVSTFTNDAGYLTSEVDGSTTNEIELPAQSGYSGKMLTTDGTSPSWADVSFNDLTDVPANLDTDDTDDFDGAYSSLSGAPTNVSTFTNDAGYLTSEVDGSTTNEIELPAQSDNSGKMLTTDGTSPSWADVSFNDLTDVPANLDTDDTDDFDGAYSSLSGAPTNVSTFTNDAGYLTSEVDGSTTNEIELPAQSDNSGKMLTTDGTSPSWADVSFNDLTDVPANLDTDDTDDFDGAYSSLSGAPTNVSTFTNDAGYLTSEVDGSTTNEIELPAQSGNSGKMLTTDGTSPSWADVSFNDLTDVPANLDTDDTDDFDGAYSSLSGAPTNVSTFTNDAGYLTSEVDGSTTNEIELPAQSGNSGKMLTTDGTSPSWADVSFNDLTDVPANLDTDDTDDFDGTYSSLTGAPTNVSTFTNDAGYLTSEVDGSTTNEIELPAQSGNSGKMLTTDGTSPSWADVSFNDLSDVPANLDTDDTDDFDGTYSSLTGAPTNVSTFTNDAGYLTSEVDGSTTNEIELPTQSGNSGKMLTTDGTSPSWADVSFNDLSDVPANLDTDDTDDFDGAYSSLTGAPTNVSSFTNDAGYLTSEVDGSTTNEIELPTQSGNSGKMLTTDGTSPSWADVSFNDLTDVPANLDTDDTDDFDGAYSSLTGAPTNVSTFTNDVGYLTSAASTNLSNISSVAVNTSLISDSDDTDDLGSTTNEWKDLYVDGTAYVDAVNVNSAYNLPTSDGASGQVLSTNGSGTLSWATDASGATQLTGLSDVNTSTATSGNILVADGTDFESVSVQGDASLASDGTLSVADNSVDGTDIALGSDASGDIMYYNGTDWVRLAKGTDNQVLTLASGVPTWKNASGGSSTSAVIKSSSYTIQAGENVIISNAVSTITFTVPSAATAGSGAVLHFYGITNSFNVSTSETIYDSNGLAQTSLSGKYTLILASDGINAWYQIK